LSILSFQNHPFRCANIEKCKNIHKRDLKQPSKLTLIAPIGFHRQFVLFAGCSDPLKYSYIINVENGKNKKRFSFNQFTITIGQFENIFLIINRFKSKYKKSARKQFVQTACEPFSFTSLLLY